MEEKEIWNLKDYMKEGRNYPEFEISKGLVAKCFEYYFKFAEYFSSLFEVDRSDKNKINKFKLIVKLFADGKNDVPDWRTLL